MPEPVTAAGVAIGVASSPMMKALWESVDEAIATSAKKMASKIRTTVVVSLKLGFDDYLVTSYNKCSLFKTILNTQKPIDLTSHYVNIYLKRNDERLRDSALIDQLPHYRRLVITGLAGSGKSMFMKYLTVVSFTMPRGLIPLFVELRRLNDSPTADLLTFLRENCRSADRSVPEADFSLSLRSGILMLILDGFDELRHDIRDVIERQILLLEKDYPNLTVVVSSRPDHRFNSWRTFHIFNVEELNLAQIESLITSFEYDEGTKARFLSEVKTKLYISHRSFLQFPLLASIMLLTFEKFAEIPQRMHLFYDNAFETLFEKHDALKEQFRRETYTGLSKDEFKRCLSAFCALSYLNEMIFFDEEQLRRSVASGIEYSKQSAADFPKELTEKEFIEDLMSSVCLIQKDGLEFVFVHRSFQEYFAAVFLAGLRGEHVRKFANKAVSRISDSVIVTAADMAPGVIESEWVLPSIEEIGRVLGLLEGEMSTGERMRILCKRLHLRRHGDGILVPVRVEDLEFRLFATMEALANIYGRTDLLLDGVFALFDVKRLNKLKFKIDGGDCIGRPNLEKLGLLFNRGALPDDRGDKREAEAERTETVLRIESADSWWLDELGVGKFFGRVGEALRTVREEIETRAHRESVILEEFL